MTWSQALDTVNSNPDNGDVTPDATKIWRRFSTETRRANATRAREWRQALEASISSSPFHRQTHHSAFTLSPLSIKSPSNPGCVCYSHIITVVTQYPRTCISLVLLYYQQTALPVELGFQYRLALVPLPPALRWVFLRRWKCESVSSAKIDENRKQRGLFTGRVTPLGSGRVGPGKKGDPTQPVRVW